MAGDIKFAHSVFALPFALQAAFMAAADGAGAIEYRRFSVQLALIVAAMVLARTTAMLANRWLDREIDARNPRTAGRALPSGRVASGTVALTIAACSAVFMLVCACFGWWYENWWPLALGLPVLAWISAYGFFKRFTALAHVYLGSSLAISPIAAAIAVQPHSVVPGDPSFQPALWLLAGMVLCWVAGFDIIYALQDVEVDRAQRLHSMPSRFGVPEALWMSRGLHAAAIALLVLAWRSDAHLGATFGIALAIAAALLLVEHLTVVRWGRTKMALTFFTLNGVVSCVLGLAGIIDIALVQ